MVSSLTVSSRPIWVQSQDKVKTAGDENNSTCETLRPWSCLEQLAASSLGRWGLTITDARDCIRWMAREKPLDWFIGQKGGYSKAPWSANLRRCWPPTGLEQYKY